jgi:hypothetical protein
MVTELHGTLKRQLSIKGRPYVVALDDSGIKLTVKGRRNGQLLLWTDLVNGDAALAVALNASLARANDEPSDSVPRKPRAKRRHSSRRV